MNSLHAFPLFASRLARVGGAIATSTVAMPMLYHRKYNVRAIGNAELGGRAFHELPRQVMSLQAVSIRGESRKLKGASP
jgi:hypothetical protein